MRGLSFLFYNKCSIRLYIKAYKATIGFVAIQKTLDSSRIIDLSLYFVSLEIIYTTSFNINKYFTYYTRFLQLSFVHMNPIILQRYQLYFQLFKSYHALQKSLFLFTFALIKFTVISFMLFIIAITVLVLLGSCLIVYLNWF